MLLQNIHFQQYQSLVSALYNTVSQIFVGHTALGSWETPQRMWRFLYKVIFDLEFEEERRFGRSIS